MQEFGGIFTGEMAKTNHVFLTTAFILAAAFIIGVTAGRWIGSSNVNEITEFIKNNELNTESYLIEQEMIQNFEEGDCALANSRILGLSSELWQIGKSLSPDDAEQKLGAKNYNFLKRKFHLMQIRTYILFYKLEQDCNSTGSIVLFYYSRNDENSEEQGEILDQLVDDYKIKVFALEYNYSKELSFVEQYYDIRQTPAIIIDYRTKLEGLSTYGRIEQEIGTSQMSLQLKAGR